MLEIRESQIEDIFATQLDDAKSILKVDEAITLIDRQRPVESGRIDLLFLSASFLHLVELKAVTSARQFCDQTVGYRNDLLHLQQQKRLPSLPLKAYLVCPKFIDSHREYCLNNDIIPIEFSPYELLKNYYYKVKVVSQLITIKPVNHGLWNLHLLNPIIYSINDAMTIESIAEKSGKSRSTTRSYLNLASELGLVDNHTIALTELGRKYVQLRIENIDKLNENQVELLREHIVKNPFSSPAVYGIYTSVETIFLLSKNFYPVPLINAHKLFTTLCGKQSEWADKASRDAFSMYSNYSVDLGLLAKLGNNYYITPAGIKFILLLDLNKSILFVNSL